MNKITKIFVCLLISVAFVMPISAVNSEIQNGKLRKTSVATTTLNGGWVDERDGFKILHLNGTNYEMGYQYGYLLSDEININLRAILNTIELFGYTLDFLLETWDIMKDYVPQRYKDEMQGMADGSGITFYEIASVNIVCRWHHCCGMAAWGPATPDGKLIHLRSFDFNPFMVDPETGTYMQENQVIVIRKPTNGLSSLSVAFIGMCGSLGGLNEEGIAIGQMTSKSWYDPDETSHGTPMFLRIRMVQDSASTAVEAIDILNQNRTIGWNFIVSDAKEPIGYAVEQTANTSYYGTYDDPVETNNPFYAIDHVVRRTNCFISPECAATQRKYYSPTPFPFLRYFLYVVGLGTPNWFETYYHYMALSNEIEDHWGSLDIDTTMTLLRDVYHHNTDVFWWKVLGMLYDSLKPTRCRSSIHQWVACPETGDMLVSFADADNLASENTVHSFNFYELLEATPP